MTNEQINAAIAKACGWKWVRSYQWTDSNGLAAFEWDIPNYCADLNAMHEAELIMDDEQYNKFSDFLYETERERQKQTQKWRWLSSTARQRAEAFLRTLGKWEEVQG